MIAKCNPSKRKIGLLTFYIIFLFATSLIPMDREIGGLEFLFALKPAIQNVLHIPLFMLLSILWLQVLQGFDLIPWQRLAIALTVSGLIGIMNEFIQILVPGRYPSIMDATFNLLGTIIGIVVFYRIARANDGFIKRMVCE